MDSSPRYKAENLSEAQIALRSLYKRDLFLFARDICGYKDITWESHGQIVEALQSETKRKLICVPRGTFKSSLCSVAYPLWLLANDPNLRILIDSELYTNSKNFLREIKAICKTEQFVSVFGDWEGPLWSESEIIVKARTKPLKEASISCSGIGAIKVSQHYEVLVGDDLSSTASVNTPELAQKVINHYRLYTSLLEPDGTIVVVGTRYSTNDIVGFILENELGIKDLKELDNYLKNQ